MDSNQLFSKLEIIRIAVTRKAGDEEIDKQLRALKASLLVSGVSEVIIDEQLSVFRSVFVEANLATQDTKLKEEIQNALPHVNLEQCNLKVYQALIPYAKLRALA